MGCGASARVGADDDYDDQPRQGPLVLQRIPSFSSQPGGSHNPSPLQVVVDANGDKACIQELIDAPYADDLTIFHHAAERAAAADAAASMGALRSSFAMRQRSFNNLSLLAKQARVLNASLSAPDAVDHLQPKVVRLRIAAVPQPT